MKTTDIIGYTLQDKATFLTAILAYLSGYKQALKEKKAEQGEKK